MPDVAGLDLESTTYPGTTDELLVPRLMGLFRSHGAEVAYHDPYVPNLDHGGIELESLATQDARGFDLAVVVTDHACFDYARLVREAPLVLDCRNATRDVPGAREKVVRL